jgi:O-antigen ligase
MPLPAMINLTMILSLVFYPVLVKSPESVFRGFYTGCSILSVFVIFFFIVKGYYLSPLQIMVKERNWGEDIFPFWGNGFAVVLALSSLMLLAQRHYLLWAVNILAAVLTTSRTPFIALIISLLVIFMQNKHIRIRIILIVFVLISLNTGIKYYMDLEYSESMIARLEKTEDREVVLGENMNAFKDNWLFGIGNIKYGEYLHAHNVFLQIMSRNGIIALALYLLLILPAKKALGLQYKYVAAIVFLWIASFVQVALMACHIIMLYSLMTMHPKFLTINKIKK